MRYPLKKINEDDVCAEIGVWKGDFSTQILKHNPSELHLIDPWVHQDYKKMWYSIKQEEMDKIHNAVHKKFKNDSRVKIHRKFSTDVKFPVAYFDWVYIDGNHTYPMVLKDLEFYLPLVKPGGFLCGDDYGWTSVDCRRGPKPAVDQFVKTHKLNLEIHNTQFVISI